MSPSALVILGLHHAQITIPRGSEDEARQFYVKLLGLTEIEKPQSLAGRGGFWLRVGDRELHVGTEDGVDRRATKAHLAYRVSGLQEWCERLGAACVEILASAPIPGYDRFEFRDPFGNRVEMIEPTAAAG
jgi:catechol 2,3-dioxygenase-like lactoylglutathione lyase family enzyme